MQYYVTWHRVANSLYIGKNKCETNKCEEACWESNVMNKNYELSPTASSSTCPEKEMHCTMNAPKGFFENCIWCSITIIFTYTISQLRQLTAGVSLLSSVSSSRRAFGICPVTLTTLVRSWCGVACTSLPLELCRGGSTCRSCRLSSPTFSLPRYEFTHYIIPTTYEEGSWEYICGWRVGIPGISSFLPTFWTSSCQLACASRRALRHCITSLSHSLVTQCLPLCCVGDHCTSQ